MVAIDGQPTAPAPDTIDLMNAPKIDEVILAGFDWEVPSADIVAALWPQRCKGLLAVSSRQSGKNPLPPEAEYQWQYQFYFATERDNGSRAGSINSGRFPSGARG